MMAAGITQTQTSGPQATMKNGEISGIFDRMADLIEIQGGDRFRVNSYRRSARAVKDLTEDITAVAADNRLTALAGVGKSTAAKIAEFLSTGRIAAFDELLAKIPAGLPDLLEIPGLGPKKVALIWNELNVESIDDLKRVIASGELATLPGLGDKSVKQIQQGIEFRERSGGRTELGVALPVAERLADEVGKMKTVKRVALAGSLRRGRETIGDVDILAVSADGKSVVEAFTNLPEVKRVLASGATKGSVLVELSGGKELQVDLRVVPAESFGAAWQYFTGSKEHNVRLREIAVKKKLKLNEWGLFDGDKPVAGKTESSIYTKLGVPAVPPELREDRGEIELNQPPKLIEQADIRGDLHMHTTASDGKCGIDEMAEAAKARGYAFIAITDHTKSSAIANGLSIERMEQQILSVREADKRIDGIAILVGCECDILADGRLDYPDDLLAELDVVVASVHAAQNQPRAKVTARVIKALSSPHVDILGHPTGRLLNRREPMDLDLSAILVAAVATDTALEINASWKRLDLKDLHIRQALDAGATLSINTDAHHTDQLDQMGFGIMTARRGWTPPDRVINTWTLNKLRKWLRSR
jgi:DNA polymerase (family 10)